MDNTALKKFAVSARHKITTGVRNRAAQFGITAQGIAPIQSLADGFIVNGHIFDNKTQTQYEHLRRRVEIDGYEAVMETASYTWFNRLIALRFMEVHDYLPIRTRILSSLKANKVEPDAVTEVLQLVEELLLDKELIYHLQDTHNTNELFKYIIEKQGMQLEKMLPNVFSPVEGDFYLLLPNDLLQDNGIIRDLITLIPEETWDDIEIVGWLYQFYVSEEKDQIFSDLKKNKKIGKQSIGPATQLFTPKWIVEYLVDNSLGRLWLENNASSNLKDKLHYYLDAAEQAPEVMEQLAALKYENLKPEDIKVMDPAMGSGHMLLHAFDVLREIYLERGYNPREIPQLIVENNLYGMDIDKRPAQLASFAIAMKARFYDRRFFSREVRFHFIGFEESNGLELFHNTSLPNETAVNAELENLYAQFFDAKIYGSILKVESVDVNLIEEAIRHLRTSRYEDIISQGYLNFEVPLIEELLEQHKLLTLKYDIVVTNPPYMGGKGMDPKLLDFVKSNYPDSKNDLFAVFIEECGELLKSTGYQAMITQHAWMFLSSYKRLRNKLIHHDIVNMAHLGSRAFEEIGGEVVQTTAFILAKRSVKDYMATYVRLVNYNSQDAKKEAFLSKSNRHTATMANFKKVPGLRYAYWLDTESIFTSRLIQDCFESGGRNKTHNNEKYVRLWWECDKAEDKWVLYSNGGYYRKWYGNITDVVNWSDVAKAEYASHGGMLPQKSFESTGITWNGIAGNNYAFRIKLKNIPFSSSAPTIITLNDGELYATLAFMNTKVSRMLLDVLNPTLQLNVGEGLQLPLKKLNSLSGYVEELSKSNIALSRADWDSFEISLDFKVHPLLELKEDAGDGTDMSKWIHTIKYAFKNWETFSNDRFTKLKANEEELNRIFIDIYGLQDVLTPEVEDKDVTVRKADVERDIRSFLSYLVGVIFGRYRLDKPGLAFAGGEFNLDDFGSYNPDKDNIIPITVEHYFEDDIVSKITELVGIIYGKDTLNENLQFIATHLGMKESESAEDTIRRYFMKDFYKDHLKIYQKRPIYWQFSSGKKGAFKGLMYLHRYDKYTLARIRTDYVLKLTTTLNQLIEHAQVIIDGNVSAKEVARARKEREAYEAQLQELREYDLILKQLADQEIDLDLDDGVKVNYAKFQDIPFKKDNGRSEKMNLFEKI